MSDKKYRVGFKRGCASPAKVEKVVLELRTKCASYRNITFMGYLYCLEKKDYYRFNLYHTISVDVKIPCNLNAEETVLLIFAKLEREVMKHFYDRQRIFSDASWLFSSDDSDTTNQD